ncbi:DUF1573 domain-containing protein [Tenacibaculum sp. TC6]|uniref:DUF1573 domain-containing protein n=1 Tax=Tenacibaculum sp. TC6 TaxID=3423223 RepID=UPI003D361AEC
MRTLILFLVIYLVTNSMNAQEFKFVTETIDYGKVAFNSEGKRTFEFTNIGAEPLLIKEIKSSCGCSVPKKPEKPIMPGKKGFIEIEYDTKRLGGFSKSLIIISNAKEERKLIKIKGLVEKKENNKV